MHVMYSDHIHHPTPSLTSQLLLIPFLFPKAPFTSWFLCFNLDSILERKHLVLVSLSWLISLNTTISGSFHVPKSNMILFFMAEKKTHSVYTILSKSLHQWMDTYAAEYSRSSTRISLPIKAQYSCQLKLNTIAH